MSPLELINKILIKYGNPPEYDEKYDDAWPRLYECILAMDKKIVYLEKEHKRLTEELYRPGNLDELDGKP